VFPRSLLFVGVACVVALIGWFAWLSDFKTELEGEVAAEEALKTDFSAKLTKAVSLDALKKQREQVLQYVTQLEKQLPSKAEMSALLSDINQAGLGRSLQFDCSARPDGGQGVLRRAADFDPGHRQVPRHRCFRVGWPRAS
jgi:type IV pilus assembly protein PilO